MKAGFIKQHGDIDQIQVGEMDAPTPLAGEVIIETQFAALNHLDIFVAKGWPGLKLTLPHILGSDGAGIVKEVGSGVTTVRPGDRVTVNPGISCGKCTTCLSGQQNLCLKYYIIGEHRHGTYAQFFKVPEENVLTLPDDYPFDLAAAAPLTFLTAWRMLVTKGQVKAGEFVFVHGASGGVATAAIQIAKFFGATVITSTSSEAKIKKAHELGADHVINYQAMPDYSKYVYKELTHRHGIDLVVDSVGEQTFPTSIKLLKPGGRLVTCGATTGPKTSLDIRPVFWKQLSIMGSTMSNQAEFRAVMDLVLQKKLTPVIDRVFPLAELQDAERYLETASQFGKVLIEP